MSHRSFVVVLLVALGIALQAQQPPEVRCPAGMVASSDPGGVVTCKGTTTPPVNTAVITNATANPSTIAAPGPTTLNWTSTGGNPLSIVITPGNFKPAVSARSFPIPSVAVTTMFTVTYNEGTPQRTWRSVTVVVTTAPPGPVNCDGVWSAWAPVPPGTWSACTSGTQTRPELRTFTITNQPSPPPNAGKACPVSPENRTATQACSSPTPGAIYGVVDPEILGDYSAAEHDAFVVQGTDGVRYRTWHAQCPVTGRCYKHEHGVDPAPLLATMLTRAEQLPEPDRTIAIARTKEPIMFGYIGKRHPSAAEPNGHEEPHEGFKLFIAFENETNDENRTSKIVSLHVTHMGTGGAGRFNQSMHSVESRQIHDSGAYGFTRFMMEFGEGTGTVCDPRRPGPTRDVMQLNSPCKLGSSYEIWTGHQTIKLNNEEKFRAFATPASFDPITVLDPANRTRVVVTWSDEMKPSRAFPNDDWTHFRGCDREAYAQMGYYYNQQGGQREYVTDVHGVVQPAGPLTLTQSISILSTLDLKATDDGLGAYKVRRPNCGNRAALGLKN